MGERPQHDPAQQDPDEQFLLPDDEMPGDDPDVDQGGEEDWSGGLDSARNPD